MEAPVLKLIDPKDLDAKFEIHTDASGFAIGAVLYQESGKSFSLLPFTARSSNWQKGTTTQQIRRCWL